MIEGNGYPVTTFKEMLIIIVEYLYEKNKFIIDDIAINNKTLLPWTKQIHITNNQSDISNNYRISNSNIYVKMGMSASHIINVIKELLYRYAIDSDECYYLARITDSYVKNNT